MRNSALRVDDVPAYRGTLKIAKYLNYDDEDLCLSAGCLFCLHLVLDARIYMGFHACKIVGVTSALTSVYYPSMID